VIFSSSSFSQLCLLHQNRLQSEFVLFILFHALQLASFQGQSKARRDSIAVQRPTPAHAPPITRTDKKVRSDRKRLDKDDKMNLIRFQHYLDHAPKIVLPVTLRSMQKPLTPKGMKKLEELTEKLQDPFQPARCTSAQYLDRNGDPLLFYFGRRLVHPDDKKVSLFPALLLCLAD
jgi:hypothetical protein